MLRSTDIPLLYVECDMREGESLLDWRRERVAAARRDRAEAREARSAARAAAFKRLLPRLPRLRPAPTIRPRIAKSRSRSALVSPGRRRAWTPTRSSPSASPAPA